MQYTIHLASMYILYRPYMYVCTTHKLNITAKQFLYRSLNVIIIYTSEYLYTHIYTYIYRLREIERFTIAAGSLCKFTIHLLFIRIEGNTHITHASSPFST